MNWKSGKLLYIHIAPIASADMIELEEAELVVGKGIVNDRYFNQSGTYSKIPDIRDITLIENEVLDALASNQPPLQKKSIILKPIEHRRNLTTSGVPLNYLVGKKFQIGEVILKGGRLNFPCKYLADLLKKPLLLPLYNRSGLNCSVERGGVIRKGDKIIQIEN
ncbi:MOSC domain-containing protein [Alphaproteobacteria bacterium]|jgi:MOSC domain-containing protein YiiM|nr:MOSC domain-containing protein [Alphaproteobacteria bacterium]|tara:strand:- start:78 stop:569 length:492 start_codon:yes stop_codon:yes gene_type:complete